MDYELMDFIGYILNNESDENEEESEDGDE